MHNLFLLNACDKLDEEPLTNVSTNQFYSNETDALAALNGAYSRLKSGNGYYKQLFYLHYSHLLIKAGQHIYLKTLKQGQSPILIQICHQYGEIYILEFVMLTMLFQKYLTLK